MATLVVLAEQLLVFHEKEFIARIKFPAWPELEMIALDLRRQPDTGYITLKERVFCVNISSCSVFQQYVISTEPLVSTFCRRCCRRSKVKNVQTLALTGASVVAEPTAF